MHNPCRITINSENGPIICTIWVIKQRKRTTERAGNGDGVEEEKKTGDGGLTEQCQEKTRKRRSVKVKREKKTFRFLCVECITFSCV